MCPPFPYGLVLPARKFDFSPKLLSISPSHGSVAGGTSVTITGNNLLSPSLLQLGGVDITVLTNDGSTITGTTQAGNSAGLVDLVITTVHGTNTLARSYNYDMLINRASPANSPLASNTVVGMPPVIVQGKGFLSLNQSSLNVTLNGVSALASTILSDDRISCVPANSSASIGSITVTDGTLSATGGSFEYADPNSILGSNLEAWFDASFGITGASNVSSWLDQSPNAHTAVQATGGNQPSYIQNDPDACNQGSVVWPAQVSGGNSIFLKAAGVVLTEPYTVLTIGLFAPDEDGCIWAGATSPFAYLQHLGDLDVNDIEGGGYSASGITTLLDSQPSFIVDVRNGASSKLYLQGTAKPYASGSTPGSGGSGGFVIGNIDGGGLGLGGFTSGSNKASKIFAIIVAKIEPSSTQLTKLLAWANSRWGHVTPPGKMIPSTNLCVTGNSYIFGAAASDLNQLDLTDLAFAAMPPYVSCTKDGNSGAQTSALMSGATSIKVQNLAAKEIYGMLEIGNDIQLGLVSGATAFANVETWVTNLNARSKNPTPIIFTCNTRGADAGWTGGMETARIACNASLLSGAVPYGGITYAYTNTIAGIPCYICDVASIPEASLVTNPAWFNSALHPTDALHAKFAIPFIQIVKTLIV